MSRSEWLHAESERHREEYMRLLMIGGRVGIYDHERERLIREATERWPRPMGFEEAQSLASVAPRRTLVMPDDSVALRADSVLGLLADLADTKFRATYLEALRMEQHEYVNVRALRDIADLRRECDSLRAAMSDKRRKAKATEAQRRKAGDRRRRNAR